MLETRISLDDAAFGLLRANTSAHPEFTRVLIRGGSRSIDPLFQSLISWQREHNRDHRHVASSAMKSKLGQIVGLSLTHNLLLDPTAQSVFRIIELVDAPLFTVLLQMLRHQDPDVVILSSLLVGLPHSPTEAFRDALLEAYVELLDSCPDHITMLMVIALANAGDNWADDEVDRMASHFDSQRDTAIAAARAEALLKIGSHR